MMEILFSPYVAVGVLVWVILEFSGIFSPLRWIRKIVGAIIILCGFQAIAVATWITYLQSINNPDGFDHNAFTKRLERWGIKAKFISKNEEPSEPPSQDPSTEPSKEPLEESLEEPSKEEKNTSVADRVSLRRRCSK
jgi:hypothetical protein